MCVCGFFILLSNAKLNIGIIGVVVFEVKCLPFFFSPFTFQSLVGNNFQASI